MGRGIIIVAVFFCYSLAVATPNVSLTGTVVNAGNEGIKKARVSLKKYPAIVAFTDDMGAFTLPATNPVRTIRTDRIAATPHFKNNRIVFMTSSVGQTVLVDIFAANGVRLSASRLTDLSPGDHSLSLRKTAVGIYFVKMTIGNETHMLKMAAGLNGCVGIAVNSGFKSPSSAVPGKSASAALVDTLIVVARDYKHALRGLSVYTERDIQLELAKSNPWLPNVYPEKANGMVGILAKGYDFEMGQPDPNIEGENMSNNEQAVHTVEFTYDFWMDTIEVTQKDFATLMAATYSNFVIPKWPAKYGLGDKYPAYYISWADAALYCNARSKRDGFDTVYTYTSLVDKPGEVTCELVGGSVSLAKNGYRLPTEAEWEYAYKCGLSFDFYWYQNYNPYPANHLDTLEVGSYEVWRANSWDKDSGNADYGTHPVGTKINNNYCLYDMAGNVSEYCQGYWENNYDYGTVIDPMGLAAGAETAHIIRGGNWGSDVTYLRAANRIFNPADYPYFFLGFRCVRPVK